MLGQFSRFGAAVEAPGVTVGPGAGPAVVLPPMGGAVAAAVVAMAGSWGGLVVAGAGVVVIAVALVDFGAAEWEGTPAACCVVETSGVVGAGVVVAVAAGGRSPPSCLAVGRVRVGSLVWAAPSAGRVAVLAVAVGWLPLGTTVVLPASSGTGERSLDTGLAPGSPACERTLSSRAPGGQHKRGNVQ